MDTSKVTKTNVTAFDRVAQKKQVGDNHQEGARYGQF